MKRALFVGYYPNNVEPYLRSFFQGLIHSIAEKGIECTVVAPVSVSHYKSQVRSIPYETYDKTKSGVKIKVYHPRYISYSSKKIGMIKTGYFSEKAFQRSALKCASHLSNKFDFVYGHFFLTGGLAAVKIGRELNIPSFIAYGECDYESQILNDYGKIFPHDIDGLTGVISVSTQNTNELKRLGIIPGVPILTAPNATDLSMFYRKNKMECRNKLGIPEDVFLIGFVGGFIERKGDKRLLEAVNQIDDAYVGFAGKGDDPPTGEKVVFCKALDHSAISDFLNAIDVFCLPTLSEGSCNAIVEAMACGVPIISSNLPFNDDVLDSSNSIRVDPKSVKAIKFAIEELKCSYDKRMALSHNSLEKALSFDIKNRAKCILNFIYDLSNIEDDIR